MRNIENQEILLTRCFPDMMISLVCEFEMIGEICMAEHDAVKPLMIFKRINHLKSESISVESDDGPKIIRRPGNS